MKRMLALLAACAVFASGGPALARHQDRHCTLTIHHPLGTSDLELPAPLPQDLPRDIGFVKVFVNCHHGHDH